jgi:hypothetical protein
MNRTDLLQKCKEMGIKGVSSKTKKELLLIINENENEKEQSYHVNISTNTLTNVLNELIIKIPKDKLRKVCKNCYELGHNKTSTFCKINIDRNNKLKQKIKKYILSSNWLEEKSIDEYCIELSVLLEITPSLCKTLYNEIPLDELLDRDIDMEIYLKNMNQLSKRCNECNKKIICIQSNTNHIWNGNDICDTCWSNHESERNLIWEQIIAYKPIQCEICNSIKTHPTERYHYDHLNMFNKDKSVCSMVNECVNIEEIFSEIDKCQILCLSCHHIVTDIERKLGFTRIKQMLTRNLNNCEITEEEYNKQTQHYQKIYEEKMKDVYKELKLVGIEI